MTAGRLTPLFALAARWILVGVFVSAALPKIADPVAFNASIVGFQVIDGVLASWVAIVLPWLELVIAIGLLIQPIRRVSGVLISLLLIVFIGLHTSAWLRGLDISCGCFGTEAEPTTNYDLLILRNLILLAVALWVLRRDFNTHAAATKIAI
ncbi:MAG: MauE/DoxX family redox-associated membrane protein [Opitutaceae bacterium]